jgi:virginiamycin B lyase
MNRKVFWLGTSFILVLIAVTLLHAGSFQQVFGALDKVVAGSDCSVWGVVESSPVRIFAFNPVTQSFRLMTSPVSTLDDISVGDGTSIWLTGNCSEFGCQTSIFRFDVATQTFEQIPGGFAQVFVGNRNAVWAADPEGESQAFKFDPAVSSTFPWKNFGGPNVLSVSVGVDGAVWAIGDSHHVFRFDAGTQTWNQIPSSQTLVQISVGNANAVWGIDGSGLIFRFSADGSTVQNIPGQLQSISVGRDGTVWGLNATQKIFKFNPKSQIFQQFPGLLTSISVGGSDACVWGLNSSRQIFTFRFQ